MFLNSKLQFDENRKKDRRKGWKERGKEERKEGKVEKTIRFPYNSKLLNLN